ncbi:hypothetical protein ACFLYV_04600 [Chloroflexota bacterium]
MRELIIGIFWMSRNGSQSLSAIGWAELSIGIVITFNLAKESLST